MKLLLIKFLNAVIRTLIRLLNLFDLVEKIKIKKQKSLRQIKIRSHITYEKCFAWQKLTADFLQISKKPKTSIFCRNKNEAFLL